MAGNDANREFYLRTVERRSDLDGRFTDIRRIGATGGSGHFSLMFSALDKETGRRVALKFFNPDKRSDAYRFECFEREVEVMEVLKHLPRVISLVSPRSGFDEQVPTDLLDYTIRFDYYAADFVARDMLTIIEEGSWSPERRLVAFKNMCLAVRDVHAMNIAHRDLKPDNFLITRRGAVRLCDLGTARQFDGPHEGLRPVYGIPVGDTRYVAPELLALLHDADPTIAFGGDIYSLGAILFELFTGQVLGHHLHADHGFVSGLAMVGFVNASDRIRVYDQILPAIANRELPSVADYKRIAPDVVLARVDALYRSMAALDYRDGARLKDFRRILQQINLCLLTLRNHRKSFLQERQQARKEVWRQARLARRERRASLALRQGGTS